MRRLEGGLDAAAGSGIIEARGRRLLGLWSRSSAGAPVRAGPQTRARRGPRLRALFGCMYCGMRPSEAVSLLLTDCTLPEHG
jgi:hypothetical protein